MGAPPGGSGSANPLALWLPLLIIGYLIYFFVRYFRKRKSLMTAEEIPPLMNQTNKRILGIILASVGGVGGILFGLVLSSTSNRFYLIQSQKESDMSTYSTLTIVSIIIFIIGLIMILTAKSTKEISTKVSDGETSTSKLDELEKLASLKDKGIITEEEFNARKKKILEI